jgi:hypothetical protein
VSAPAPAVDDESPDYEPASQDYGHVIAVWNYEGTLSEPPSEGMKLVAAELDLPAPEDSFDLDDIDIFDADTGANYGSGAPLQRLTASGDRVDDEDPDVKNDRAYRGIFAWTVPRTVTRVNFGYWGTMLYVKPTAIRAKGPVVGAPDQTPASFHAAGEAPDDRRCYRLVLHATQWSRVATPQFSLIDSTRETKDDCPQARWIEIDAQGRPIDVPLEGRPHYLDERRFLIEFWCPATLHPDTLSRFRLALTPLPAETKDALPTETQRRLESAPLSPLSRAD